MKAESLNRWWVLLCAALFFHYEFFQINMFNVLEPELVREFSTSATAIGWISSTYFYGTIILLFPAGLILDRVSTRKLILFAMTVTLIGTWCFSQATSLWFAAVGRFLVGLCAGPFALISVIKLATQWFKPKELSLVAGIAVSIGMLGGILAQMPFHLLVQSVGWRSALHVNILVGFFMLLLIFFVVKDRPVERLENEDGIEKGSIQCSTYGLVEAVSMVTSKANNWKMGLYAGLTNLPVFVLGSLFSSLYLTQAHGLTALQASYASTMIFIGMLIGSPVFGWVSSRVEKRRPPMIFGASIALLSMMIVMLTAPTFWQLIILFFILGFGASAHTLVYTSVAESNSLKLTGAAEGLAAMLIMLGGAIFQPLCGWLLDMAWDGSTIAGVPVYSDKSFYLSIGIIPITLIIGILLVVFSEESFQKAN